MPLENSSNEKSTPIKTGEGKKEDITISTSINMPTSEPLPESEPKSDSKNISLQQAKLVDSTFLDPVANIPKANSENLTKQHETATGIEFGRKNDIIPGAQKTPLTNPQLLELTIKTEEHSWFELLIDGTRVEDFILPAGTGKTFKGKESFKITIGNRNGTRLLLNGTALVLPKSPPTEKDVVRNFLIQTKLLN